MSLQRFLCYHNNFVEYRHYEIWERTSHTKLSLKTKLDYTTLEYYTEEEK